MSASKVVWASPEINRSRKLLNAKLSNDVSMQSLKWQVVFSVAIITEICLNLLFKFFGGANSSIYVYMLICKTFLAINIVFIISYIYQIIHARIRMYLFTRDNRDQSLVKCIIFEMLPQVKHYYEKLIKCKWLSPWLQKEAIALERIQAKLDEERRKSLYKMYFPSLQPQYCSYGDISMKRDVGMSADLWYSGTFQDSIYKSTPDRGIDYLKSFNTSTPYSRRRVMCAFPNDMAMVPSPIQQVHTNDVDMRNSIYVNSFDVMQVNHQLSPMASPRAAMHSLSAFQLNRNQSDVINEVSFSDVWTRLGIDSRNLDQWTLNMKQWLHGTIISRVVQEIEKLNERFAQFGLNEAVIGETNVQSLRQLASQHGHNFPTLSVLINFIDCSKDQAYVVNRITELSQGCSLGQFHWDSGSSSVRQPWKEHLPNDTILVLHLLSAYVDSRVNSNSHGIRTFSQQFIIDIKDGLGDSRDRCALLQTSVQPPHFKVIIEDTIYNIGAGRKNMLECLLLFFYKVYRDEGNLKWLNLGRSGLNLNWIFDQTK